MDQPATKTNRPTYYKHARQLTKAGISNNGRDYSDYPNHPPARTILSSVEIGTARKPMDRRAGASNARSLFHNPFVNPQNTDNQRPRRSVHEAAA